MKKRIGMIIAMACMTIGIAANAGVDANRSSFGKECNVTLKPRHKMHGSHKNKKRYNAHQHTKNRHERVARYSTI